jgi:hypothetical protein
MEGYGLDPLAMNIPLAGSYEHGSEPWCSVKGKEFRELLNYFQHLKDSAAFSSLKNIVATDIWVVSWEVLTAVNVMITSCGCDIV